MATEAREMERWPVPATADILPANLEAEIARAKQMRAALDKLFDELLVPGVDYDRIPGTDKPTLYKSGAELLCQVFRLAPGKPEMTASHEDYQNGVFSYTIAIPIYHRDTGVLIAYGIGSANSKEPKYRYRKSKDDPDLKIENPDPAGDQNTLVKMAAKRSFVDGVLKATGASRKFTQDVEDLMLPEKASSKQISYIKSLSRGKKDDEILAAVGEILGRELAGWDDLTREEASRVIDAKKAEGVKGDGAKGSQKRAIPDAPKPKGNGVNWNAFWSEVRNELNLEKDTVQDEARRYFGQPGLGSLTEAISDQTALNEFLAHLRQVFNGKRETA